MKLLPGNWFAPPGSNRSGGGGNKPVGAFDGKGRLATLELRHDDRRLEFSRDVREEREKLMEPVQRKGAVDLRVDANFSMSGRV